MNPARRANPRSGMTLVEILLAMGLLALVTTTTYMCFSTALRAWRTGTSLAERFHHADVLMEQLSMGLRSAYYPDTGAIEARYGLQHEDDGDGPTARDRLRWVKIGSALIGSDETIAGVPHRVEVSVGEDADNPGDPGFQVKAWRIDAQRDDLDPALHVPSTMLSRKVIGFDCRFKDPEAPEDELEWIPAWEEPYTNRLPYLVELTLTLSPVREDGEPVEVRRVVELPLADLSWNPRRISQRGRGRTAPRNGAAP